MLRLGVVKELTTQKTSRQLPKVQGPLRCLITHLTTTLSPVCSLRTHNQQKEQRISSCLQSDRQLITKCLQNKTAVDGIFAVSSLLTWPTMGIVAGIELHTISRECDWKWHYSRLQHEVLNNWRNPRSVRQYSDSQANTFYNRGTPYDSQATTKKNNLVRLQLPVAIGPSGFLLIIIMTAIQNRCRHPMWKYTKKSQCSNVEKTTFSR